MAVAAITSSKDLSAMLRLSHQVHAPKDAGARKQLLLAGLCDMLPATMGLCLVAHLRRASEQPRVLSASPHGITPGEQEQWTKSALHGIGLHSIAQGIDDDSGSWKPHRRSTRIRHPRCIVDYLLHPAQLGGSLLACVLIARPDEAKPFAERERQVVHLIHAEMGWIYRSDVLLASEGASLLSPRQHQTLQYLLAGNSEKEIAEKMSLSPNTVHHHVKALHRHFGVSSRSELLARWVR